MEQDRDLPDLLRTPSQSKGGGATCARRALYQFFVWYMLRHLSGTFQKVGTVMVTERQHGERDVYGVHWSYLRLPEAGCSNIKGHVSKAHEDVVAQLPRNQCSGSGSTSVPALFKGNKVWTANAGVRPRWLSDGFVVHRIFIKGKNTRALSPSRTLGDQFVKDCGVVAILEVVKTEVENLVNAVARDGPSLTLDKLQLETKKRWIEEKKLL